MNDKQITITSALLLTLGEFADLLFIGFMHRTLWCGRV
jgi:hypothetical protein